MFGEGRKPGSSYSKRKHSEFVGVRLCGGGGVWGLPGGSGFLNLFQSKSLAQFASVTRFSC